MKDTKVMCPNCKGKKIVNGRECRMCDGTGKISKSWARLEKRMEISRGNNV